MTRLENAIKNYWRAKQAAQRHRDADMPALAETWESLAKKWLKVAKHGGSKAS